ncbi:exopolysaccharide biosynthesis polyprenyl glycosylphosphotransferase [Pseudonocardia sediminis]|uniref:Exopolysaccharide biosynthesis polyprenyl glycosylphosphotransferase n=1 Tax=Pseudonocardia sediminis TaxID=1397368 RepID=A0A4Q7V5F6_PSEST|nr:sugar transferase [Pseudonocardia sediminis]RZT87889.1 exopolysaccharide biosynthesis polyprenyl glycosylphosphotransferase [Pseudonocardia sediminis]
MSTYPDVTRGRGPVVPGATGRRRIRVPRQRVVTTTTPVGREPQGIPRWQRRFSTAVALSDLTTITVVVSMCVLVGLTGFEAGDRARIASGLLAAALMAVALPLSRAWDGRVLGQGATEFVRLGRAVLLADVALAFGGLALMVQSAREWVFLLVPVTGLACLAMRFVLRKALHHQRRNGRGLTPVLAVGSEEAVADLVRRTRRDPYFGWEITGACTPTGRGTNGGLNVDGVRVVGDLDSVPNLARGAEHHVVAVCQAPGWGPARLHRLAWQLEGTNAELAVDPGLMEIAGPRMHITPVDGMPLLRLSHPRFTGVARILKTAMDRTVAGLLLLVAAPVFVGLALAVRLHDGGPVFFTQERVGTNGRTFRMIKFRSMCTDAEARLAALAHANDGAGPLFKMREDPRVTPVGRFLRKYSMDELPQLLNVLNGSMSLVGPRPPLPREVAGYADDARRRLLVRPGMTGLWQVSGRSTLTWEESVRLDLRYVENWSLALDFIIIWKTFGAVLRSRGAY